MSSIIDGKSLAVLHEDKEQVLLNYFCSLMGAQVDRANGIDIAALDLPLVNSVSLDSTFTHDEVWNVVKELRPDNAPGPDGFTGKFYQKAWPIINNQERHRSHTMKFGIWSRNFHQRRCQDRMDHRQVLPKGVVATESRQHTRMR